MRDRVLAIAHVDAWAENRILAAIRQLGAAVDVCNIERGDVVPVCAAPYAGIIIGGGLAPVSHTHRYPFLKREIRLISDALEQQVPFLGICLGAQLLAAALGEVAATSRGRDVELGYHPIESLNASMEFPSHVFQWHWEGVALPAGAELLARGERFPTQAFRFGATAYGLQFHPCVGVDEVAAWINSFPSFRMPGRRDRLICRQQALAEEYDPPVRRWLAGFLPPWLASAV